MKKKIKSYKKICTLLIMSILIGSTPINHTYGATKIKLYNYTTKSTINYSDSLISYVYEGKSINLGNTPGVLSSNGVALGSFDNIFRKVLGLNCSLDKSKKKITIASDDTEIVMTIGSKKAYVNGKAVTMNAAPVTYKYFTANKSLALVPTRFVAETLGYVYEWNSSTSTVSITKPLSLYYDNKTVNYKGTKGKVKLDGKNINVQSLPTIIISNTAMLQAWKVFSKSMGVTYQYDLSTGDLTFTKGKITVTMKLGSKTAYINGMSVSCPVAPKLIKNLTTNKEMVIVPGQFLAKALGYKYSWNANTKTSEITSTSNVGVNSGITITPTPTVSVKPSPTPTSSDSTDNSSSIDEVIATYFTWTLGSDFQSEISSAKNAIMNAANDQVLNTDSTTTTNILDIVKETTVSTITSESFTISLGSPLTSVTANKTDDTVTLTFINTVSDEHNYSSLNSQLVSDISSTYDINSTTSSVKFQLADDSYYYDMILAEDKKSISVNIYPNYIENISGGEYANGTQYIQLTGIKDVEYEIKEDDYYVYLTLPNTANKYGEKKYYSEDISHINYVLLESPVNLTTNLIIQKPYQGAKYQVSNNSNIFRLNFITNETDDETEEDTDLDSNSVTISLPEGVTESVISDEDKYYNKQIVISISGNYVDYFKSNPIQENHDKVSGVTVSYSNKKTLITIKTTKVQGYFLEYGTNSLKVNIANPSEIYKKIVVLDAGHGGVDPGTLKGTVYEKDIVFNILNNYAKDYFSNSDIKVYYSRIDDTKINLHERADFASEVEADLFVSLHVNASSDTSVKGSSVYYCTTNNKTQASGLSSLKLASSLIKNLSSTLGTKNLGVKTANFVVIGENTVPAVLIELAFITNSSDYKLLINKTFQRNTAKSIYDTIDELFDKYPTKR